MGTTEYVFYLIAAVLLTVAVGQVLLRRGQPFLEEVFQSNEAAHSINILLSVLFHLLTLGVLALLSTIDVPIVTQFGIALIVVGIAYGISMLVLLRIRERRRQDQLFERRAEQRQRSQNPTPVDRSRTAPPSN
ncbi:hypothetical protein GCM10010472_73950 [Pseudonocardia halophobica]|uniref:Uncharacterized protein n=1 Tax=Pseudonocardia halophobica TaxID=29401 RepID=A0A9W6P0X0_9PSEU|nr:hypothetical protein GCM10017577_69170 [Pseudonocardia halophobica]